MKIIVGLGNPGEQYQKTRHNLGFMIMDEFGKKHIAKNVWRNEEKFKSEIIQTNYQLPTTNYQLILVKPQTHMNNSGLAVLKLINYFKIAAEDLVVVYDELDLPLGKIKVRLGGAAAGHHGVESIINTLKTDKFVRVRLGIGNLRTKSAEHGGQNVSAETFVLSPFSTHDKSELKRMIKHALLAIDTILEKGLEKSQNQFN